MDEFLQISSKIWPKGKRTSIKLVLFINFTRFIKNEIFSILL